MIVGLGGSIRLDCLPEVRRLPVLALRTQGDELLNVHLQLLVVSAVTFSAQGDII